MNEKSGNTNLAKSSVWNLLTSVFAKIGTLIFTILLARMLMPENFGIYSIVLSIMTITFTLFDLGLNQSIVKFYSEKLGKNKEEANTYYKYISELKYKLSFISSLFLLIISYPVSYIIFENSALFLPMVFSSLYLFIFSVDSFYVHVFYSIKKVKYVAIREIINQLSKIAVLLILFSFIEKNIYVVGAIVTGIISYSLCVFYMAYNKRRILGNAKISTRIKIDKNKIYKFAVFVYLANIANSLLFYIDSLILGVFVNPAYVGYYKSAFSLVLGITGIGMAPVLIILPYLVSMSKNNQEKVVLTYAKLIALFAIPATLGIIILGKYFLNLFFGSDYLLAYMPLALLSLLIFPQIIVSSLFFNVCSARNSPHLFLRNVLITTVLNIILNFVIISILVRSSELNATIGAALACVLSWIFYFTYSVQIMKKEFKIKINYGILVKPLIAGFIMVLVLLYAQKIYPDMNLISGIFEIALGAGIYFAGIYLLNYLDKKEIDKIIGAIRR